MIDARVTGIVARVSVRQEFLQRRQRTGLKACTFFRCPMRLRSISMRLYIGERFIEGEIREKEQAKKEYEAGKISEGKKASLVEQQRANLFTTSVANIAPQERRWSIELEYLRKRYALRRGHLQHTVAR